MTSRTVRPPCTPQQRDNRPRKTSSAHPLPLSPYSQSSTRHPTYGAQSPNYEVYDGNSLNGRFPSRLFDVLEQGTMSEYIYWHQDGESHSLYVPSIDAFVANVLPWCFPEMTQWGSFQKQLNNYGFEKRDRSKTCARFAHWDNKFWSGRRDLLPQVQRRPKAPHEAAQQHPLVTVPDTPPIASMVPQPPSQPDFYAIIDDLRNQVETANSALKNMQVLYTNMQNESNRRIARLEAVVQEMSAQRGAMSGGNSSMNSQASDGPTGGTVCPRYAINGAGHPSGTHHGLAPRSPIGIDGGPSQGGPSQMGPRMSYDTIDPNLLHQPPALHPQVPANASSANSSRTLLHASRQPTVGVPFPGEFLIQNGIVNGVGPMYFNQGFGPQQNAGASAGPQTFNLNPFATTPTSQPPARPQGSNSPGASGGPARFGGAHPVPPPQARQGWLPFP